MLIALTALAAPRPASAAPDVALLAPASAAFTAELRRELETSSFGVELLDTGQRPWRDWLPFVRASGLVRAVAVDEREGRVLVVTVTGDGGEPRVRGDLPVDVRDRLARRRVSLVVVEQLRVLRDLGGMEGETGAAPAAEGNGDRVFALGAASTINFDSYVGEPTSHALFIGQWGLRRRLRLWSRVSWPVVGSQFQTLEGNIRMWTFGVGAGLQVALGPSSWRAQPFAGVAVGLRLVLADIDRLEGLQSQVMVTPSSTIAAQIGVRYALTPTVRLLFELEAGDAQPLLLDRPRSVRDAANARAAHAALGLLFEY